MKFIIPNYPIREEGEDICSASWMAKCLYWFCRTGWYIGVE